MPQHTLPRQCNNLWTKMARHRFSTSPIHRTTPHVTFFCWLVSKSPKRKMFCGCWGSFKWDIGKKEEWFWSAWGEKVRLRQTMPVDPLTLGVCRWMLLAMEAGTRGIHSGYFCVPPRMCSNRIFQSYKVCVFPPLSSSSGSGPREKKMLMMLTRVPILHKTHWVLFIIYFYYLFYIFINFITLIQPVLK